jgi:hypothetical protein
MKRKIFILLCLLATGAIGYTPPPDKLPPLIGPPVVDARTTVVVVGGGVAAPGGCTSGTTDTSYTAEEGDWGADALLAGDVYGQSFQVSTAGSIYSIEVEIYNFTAGETVELRVGTAITLDDSYTSTVTTSHTTASFVEFVLETPMEVSASTTYYFGLKGADNAGDSRISKRRNLGGGEGYSGGAYMYGGTWTLGYSESTSDATFRIKLCD